MIWPQTPVKFHYTSFLVSFFYIHMDALDAILHILNQYLLLNYLESWIYEDKLLYKSNVNITLALPLSSYYIFLWCKIRISCILTSLLCIVLFSIFDMLMNFSFNTDGIQCLMYLYHYPDIWYEYATWHAKCGSIDSAIKVFQRALKALPGKFFLSSLLS